MSGLALDFSNRFKTRARRSGKSEEDEALKTHIHGSLYPFHSSPFASCFPDQPLARRYRTYARGTFATSTSDGAGYLLAAPFIHTNPAAGYLQYSPGAGVAHDIFSNGTNVTAVNSPYQATDFTGTTRYGRVTCMAIRCRNITSILDRGGTCYALKTPIQEPLIAAAFDTMIADLDTTGNSYRCDTNGGGWNYAVWVPTDSDQLDFWASPYAQSASSAILGPTLAFVAEAPTVTKQQIYEWEWCCHGEVTSTSSTNETIHGASRGTPHLHCRKVNTVVNELVKNPKVTLNEPSNVLAGFITDCVKAGHGVQTILDAASDLADRTASVIPQALAVGRALGSYL